MLVPPVFYRQGFLFVLCVVAANAFAVIQPLEISPAGDLFITGYYGEPATYDPESVTYTLINWQTNSTIVYIDIDEPWLTAPSSVTVAGSGEGTQHPTDIDVELTSAAYDLLPGFYTATISITHNLSQYYLDNPQIINVTLHVKVRLCEAVDNCDLAFTTGGDAEWYGQIAEAYYDDDAAQSGALPDTTQNTWLETEIDNLGDLTFWWRVSSEENYAVLELLINDELVDSISGDVGWTENAVHLEATPFYVANGYNKVQWRYAKYRAYPVGEDAGWVDYISFEAEDYLVVNPSAPLVYEKCMPVDLGDLNDTCTTTYTLSNADTVDPLDWSAEVSEGWLALDADSGTLAAGATTTVNVAFTSDVESLQAGAYSATVLFTNETETSGYEISRTITLLLSDETPPIPSMPVPEDNESGVSPTTTVLSWDGGGVQGCNTYYEVYFGDASDNMTLIYDGTNSFFTLPELDESTVYYWRVDSSNCCGTPSEASPVWTFETGEYNALVFFSPCGGGQNYAAPALVNLDFLPLIVTDSTTFVDRIASRAWEIVVVDVMGETLHSSVINALTAYYAADGRVIFSHADLGSYPDNEFLDRAGVAYVESYTVPKNVYSWMPAPMFALPNEVPDITGFLFTNTCPVSGHLIMVGEDATAYAGYTQTAQEDAAAITVNGTGRIIFNAFAPQTVVGDQNDSGKPDMVELYENQIVLVTPYGCDPDVTPPEIELLGENPVSLECGHDYVTPGVFAWDRCDGLISDSVEIDVSGLDATVEGTYAVYYSVTDQSGNTSAILERTVEVVDNTPPYIALLGDNPYVLECGYAYESPGVFAWDDCDGIISDQVVVNTDSIESGSVFYSVTDSAGHASVVLERAIEVADSEPPVITLLGDDPLIIECTGVFDDPGATALDLCDGDVSASLVVDVSTLDTSMLGEQTVRYTFNDATGNYASAERVIVVVDTTPPQISLTGEDEVTVECTEAYVEFGATAVDACGGDLTEAIIINSDAVDTNAVGEYTVSYNVADAEGNNAPEVLRTVKVVDATAPIITLVGEAQVTVECASVYADQGATAQDLCDGDLTEAIVVNSDAVDTNVVGEYTVSYNVADAEGNNAPEVLRTVVVVNTTVPVIALPAVYVPVECAVFEDAFAAIEGAFEVTAANACGDVTEDVRVKEIKVTYPRRGDEITYTVDSINASLIQEGKITGIQDEYTGTLEETIEIFQQYFLFKPAIYEISYIVQNSAAEEVTQIVRIDDQCRGPIGCYSCDSCSEQRPVVKVKQLLGNWLLIGVSLSALLVFARTNKV